jgi:hypothetical protein
MPSKFCRHQGGAPLQELPVIQPATSATPADRLALLNQIVRMINEGMCVSAMVLARDHSVQFNAATLRSWAKDRRKGDAYSHRKVYAWLAKNAVPIPTPVLPPPTPITTPVTHHAPAPSHVQVMGRRPLFVRVPSKVAC